MSQPSSLSVGVGAQGPRHGRGMCCQQEVPLRCSRDAKETADDCLKLREALSRRGPGSLGSRPHDAARLGKRRRDASPTGSQEGPQKALPPSPHFIRNVFKPTVKFNQQYKEQRGTHHSLPTKANTFPCLAFLLPE